MAGHGFPGVPEYDPKAEKTPSTNSSAASQGNVGADEFVRHTALLALIEDNDDDPISPTRYRNSW